MVGAVGVVDVGSSPNKGFVFVLAFVISPLWPQCVRLRANTVGQSLFEVRGENDLWKKKPAGQNTRLGQ